MHAIHLKLRSFKYMAENSLGNLHVSGSCTPQAAFGKLLASLANNFEMAVSSAPVTHRQSCDLQYLLERFQAGDNFGGSRRCDSQADRQNLYHLRSF